MKMHTHAAWLVTFALGLSCATAAAFAEPVPPAEAGPDNVDAQREDALDALSQFRLHAEFRTRLEFLSNDNGLGGDVHLGLRSRLGVTWTPSDIVSVVVIVQDIRKFGAFAAIPSTGGGGKTDLYLGYLHIATDQFGFQLGRQELSYDAQRLVGALDWADQGRQFDAVRLRFFDGEHGYDKASLDAFWAPTAVNGAPPFGKFADYTGQFAGMHATIPLIEAHKFATYAYYLNAGAPTTHTFTFGLYFAHDKQGAGLVYDAEGVLQISDRENIVGTGFAYAGHVGVGFDDGAFRIAGEFNIGSGEDALDPAVQAFNNLFPTNHNKYGYIDRQNWSNTINAAIRGWYRLSVSWLPTPIVFELSAWIFFRLRGQGSNDSFLGALPASTSDLKAVEIDFEASTKLLEFMSTLLGVSVWIPGGLAEDAGFGNIDVFFYFQLRLKA